MASKRTRATAADDAKSILNRIRRLVRALRMFDKEAQSRFGIGAAQMFILHVLHASSELSLNELAERTATDQSSASLAAARLVEDGYVRRSVREEDRRQVRLSLTPKGRTLVRRSPPAAQERILESVAAMQPSERMQLMTLLDKLMNGMAAGDGRTGMLFQDEEGSAKKSRRAR